MDGQILVLVGLQEVGQAVVGRLDLAGDVGAPLIQAQGLLAERVAQAVAGADANADLVRIPALAAVVVAEDELVAVDRQPFGDGERR